MKKVAVVPTLLTLGNLFCGFTAITYIIDGTFENRSIDESKLVWAAWFIFFGMVFDALDGRVARLARVTSGFGEQLDSLSDLVTFGLAPALLVRTVAHGFFAHNGKVLWLVCAAYLVCATLRLARYNVRQAGERSSHSDFEGLPTPAAAGVIASMVLLAYTLRPLRPRPPWLEDAILGSVPFAALVLAILMVSTVRYVHVANQLLSGRRPFAHVVQIALAGVLAAYWPEAALSLAFTGYAVHGIVATAFPRLMPEPQADADEADAPEGPAGAA